MSRRGAATVSLAWLALLPLAALSKPESRSVDSADQAVMISNSRTVQRLDFEAWAKFAFDRHVERQRLDADNLVTSSETLAFEVRPSNDGFDEKLVRIDGRQPTVSEVRRHRRAGRFTKHYGRVRAGEDVDDEQGFSLAWLVQFPNYEVSGLERVNGWDCVRLDFGPDLQLATDARASRVPSRFVKVMAGTLWVEQDTFHLVRAEARTLAPVPLTLGVVRILGLEVSLDAAPVAPAIWLPTRISVDSRLSILGREVHKRNAFSYSRYRRIGRAQ